jgi:hypothetical protein
MKLLPILILLLAFSSCSKERVMIDEGMYKGTFKRLNGANIDFGISQVTLNLTDGKFSGTSSVRNYPAIGAGSFSTVNEVIEFDNTSFFTADFDWSYILNGTFEKKTIGDSLVLIKSYSGTVFYQDEYRLKKQ